MSDFDTIAAVATPPGVSAVAMIRVSGPRAREIADACFAPQHRAGVWVPGKLRRGRICDPDDGEPIDDALAVLFQAPRSFTGEDLVELHVHGGPGVVASSLALLLRLGARFAGAGEFTKRAFLNGRLDLAQAEAVADLIAAESERASKAAAYRLAGGVGTELRELRRELLDRLVEIEAHVDYPDEVVQPDAAALAECVRRQQERVSKMLCGANEARVLRDGINCVIAGAPNVGKSSLLNALLQAERAIVSDVPGTTRDVIEDRIVVEGVVLRLLDTAGLRETADAIEAQGVTRARRAIGDAELVITVVDVSKPLGADDRTALKDTAGLPRVVLCNKMDLGAESFDDVRSRYPDLASRDNGSLVIGGSVLWPATIAEVRSAIARLGWGGAIDGNRALVANARQIDALTRASESLAHAHVTIDQALPVDLVSTDLRAAVAACGEVTGDTVTEEVLDGIFSRFCVGK